MTACSSNSIDQNSTSINDSNAIEATSKSNDSHKTINRTIEITHLKDTTFIGGNFVLFLRPDSLRFNNYIKEGDEIYEADSDFGFGISATIDSISKNNIYKNIGTTVTENRYIVIKDCQSCPLTFDRDTIDYGLIMISKDKKMRLSTFIHSWDYLQEIDEYFNIKTTN